MPPCASSAATHGTCNGTDFVKQSQEKPKKYSGIKAHGMMWTISQNIACQLITKLKGSIISSKDSMSVIAYIQKPLGASGY
eukprot:5884490-Ditylum_brightwellii.AAC.1